MSFFIRFASWTYRQILRLYPYRFQSAFSEEMYEVFTLLMTNATIYGPRAFLKAIIQEICALGISVFFENWLVCKEILMKRFQFSKHSGWWGALSFGAAYALIKGVSFAGFHGGIWLYLLGGLLGGFLFSFASESRQPRRWLTPFGALAFGAGHFINMLIFNNFANEIALDHTPLTLIALLEPVLIGALFGIGIGALSHDWHFTMRLTASCATGFGLGQIAGFILSLPIWGIVQAIDSYRPGFNGQLSPWVVMAGSLLIGVFTYVAAGIAGGATLGRTLNRIQST